MGDYLDTVVEEINVEYDSTEAILSYGVIMYAGMGTINETATYRLPFALGLEVGDKLSFYLGHVSEGEEPFISHKEYVSVEVTREDKLLARFKGSQLALIEELVELTQHQ